MKRKNFLTIIVIVVMVLGGCGNKKVETTVENNSEIHQEKEVENVETQPTATAQEDSGNSILIINLTDNITICIFCTYDSICLVKTNRFFIFIFST